VLVTDHLVSDPTKSVNLADSDVAEPVLQLIDAAADLARPQFGLIRSSEYATQIGFGWTTCSRSR
jgi:hypothetical protein